MELEPKSESGKRLLAALTNWTNKFHEAALDKLKRLLILYSSQVENEEKFLSFLYGQSVLDETPLNLSKQIPTTLLRVQHGLEVSLNKRSMKELVTGLEWSGNDGLVTEIFHWTEKYSTEITEDMKSLSVDLAPQRVPRRRLLSEIAAGTSTPRHRELDCKGEEKPCSALQVCNNKIIVGWGSGKIKIFNSTSRSCETMLPYYMNESGVTCMQCTCREIIAGYEDGNICVWNIARGTFLSKLQLQAGNADGEVDYATSMQWSDPKLVVGTKHGRVKIWQYESSVFTLLGDWKAMPDSIRYVKFNADYVVSESDSRTHATVNRFNGTQFRSLKGVDCMVLHAHQLIVGHTNRILQIWDISAGVCVGELEGHEDRICGVDAHDQVLASGDRSGRIIIWSVTAAVEGRPAKLATFEYPNFGSDVRFNVKIGRNFLVRSLREPNSPGVFVTDFPSL